MGTVYYMLNVSKRQDIGRREVPSSNPNGDSLQYAQCFKNARYKEERGVSSRVPIGTINYILIKVFSSKKKKKKNPLNPKVIYPKLGFSETFFLIYGREKRRL